MRVPILLCALSSTPAWAAVAPPLAELNTVGDAGACTANAEPPTAVAVEVPQGRMAVDGAVHVVGGGFRGFAVLADLPAGPVRVRAVRSTAIPAQEPYRPITLLRLIDPQGSSRVVTEMTDQDAPSQEWSAAIDRAEGGIWRIAATGGRQRDRITLDLPAAVQWGVQGEPTLTVTSSVPAQAWLWVPPGCQRLQVEQFGGQAGAVRVLNEEGRELGATALRDGMGRRLTVLVGDPPGDGLLRLDLTQAQGLAVMVVGAPGLLCPSPEAARRLRGGTVTAGGRVHASPLVARLRAWIAAQTPADLQVPPLALPTTAPADLADAQREAQLFGKYGLLGGVDAVLAADPAGLRSGSFNGIGNWTASGLAILAAFPARLNPLHGNPAVVRRAALEAFRLAADRLDGADLLAETDLFTGSTVYPVIHGFFMYGGSVGGALPWVADRLDPGTRRLWCDLAMAVGDRQADYQGYESNQWLHNLHGHLAAFRGTGERRFLGYFERQMRAFLAGAFGTDAKFGQHPAGFFLEEFGCDGNYGNMNLTALAAQLLDYRRLPEADPALVHSMLAGCERALRFDSLLWLTDRQGEEAGPTAHCSRRPDSTVVGANPAGVYLLRDDCALAKARCERLLGPGLALRHAQTMPYRAVSDADARALIAQGLVKRPWATQDAFHGGYQTGFFLHPRPATRPPAAELPTEASEGLWELPGMLAWKRGGLYLAVFHDVAGLAPGRRILGVMGGGPTALWTAATGACLLSQAPPGRKGAAEGPEQALFSGVYATAADGTFVHSGKVRTALSWVEPGRRFAIREPLAGGDLTWDYALGDAGFTLSVTFKAPAGGAWLTLPLTGGDGEAGPRLEADGALRWRAPGGTLAITGPARGALLTPALERGVRCLRLPLAADGTPLRLDVRAGP
ncbi:MAG: hypothetical protein L6R48_19845 [Planctomycetes bacterium]|nr:hypothetical protein [Planctomycetota bacterium]